MPADQIRDLFNDGICKVNIWTLLERDSSPDLLTGMVKNAVKVGGLNTVKALIAEGYLTEKAIDASSADLAYFTTLYRQNIVFNKMTALCRYFLELWYK